MALDWAYAEIGALGGELVSLIGSSAMLYEYEPADLPVLEAAAYPEYLAGLRETGWDGDPRQVRLAYTAWLALWCGAMMPGFASLYGAENGPGTTLFDCQPEEMIAEWAVMCAFALDRGEEARRLIQELY